MAVNETLCWGGLVVSVSTSQAEGHGFTSQQGHTKDHNKMVQTASLLDMQAFV